MLSSICHLPEALTTLAPPRQTVEIIFLALCKIADVDPDDENDSDDYYQNEMPQTHRAQLHHNYRLARYGVAYDLPRTREEKARQQAEAEERLQRAAPEDPWGSAPKAGASSFLEEPPF
jgi:hypothetical protein